MSEARRGPLSSPLATVTLIEKLVLDGAPQQVQSNAFVWVTISSVAHPSWHCLDNCSHCSVTVYDFVAAAAGAAAAVVLAAELIVAPAAVPVLVAAAGTVAADRPGFAAGRESHPPTDGPLRAG